MQLQKNTSVLEVKTVPTIFQTDMIKGRLHQTWLNRWLTNLSYYLNCTSHCTTQHACS